MFKKGEKVTQVQPKAIAGVVEGFAVDQETGELNVRVAYADEQEDQHVRYFKEHELQATPEPSE